MGDLVEEGVPHDGTDVGDPGVEGLVERAGQVVGAAVAAGGVQLSTAESCTGGLVTGALTAVPGSSAVVRGGVTSYAIPVKHEVLSVSQDTIDAPGVGVVSGECAAQMAEGSRRVLRSDVAVAVTGIAGPGGAEPGKPVGTVWFGLATPEGVRSERHLLSGDRSTVRRKAVWVALGLLLEGIRGRA